MKKNKYHIEKELKIYKGFGFCFAVHFEGGFQLVIIVLCFYFRYMLEKRDDS